MDNQSTAQLMYMAGNTTQRTIAEHLGVSERTIYSWIRINGWDRLRQAAKVAPILVADNLLSQVVELQNDIASRPEGKRYPTLAEAELTRKLILSLDRIKATPGLSQTMQVLQIFRSYAKDTGSKEPADINFRQKLGNLIDRFIEGKAKDGYLPYQAEYGPSNTTSTEPMPDENTSETAMPHPGPAVHESPLSPQQSNPNLPLLPSLTHSTPEAAISTQKSPETPYHNALQPTSGIPNNQEITGSKPEIETATHQMARGCF